MVTEIKDDVARIQTKITDKTTYTAGLSGITKTKEDRRRSAPSSTAQAPPSVPRASLGSSASPQRTRRSPARWSACPAQRRWRRAREKANKLTGGIVPDEKGTGLGGTASQNRKTLFGDGKSVSTTIAAGGRCQALVKEVDGSQPPKFIITTTISFDVKLGATAGKEWEAKPEAQQDTGLKGNVSVGGSASPIGAYASFKRELTAAEAKDYIEFIKANGHGSKLPEHMILATGTSQNWAAAKQFWKAMNGSPERSTMKSGE